MANNLLTLERMTYMARCEAPGALKSSKGVMFIQYNWWCEVKGVVSLTICSVLIYRYPFLASNKKAGASPKDLIHLPIHEIGYESRLVTAFSSQ